MPLLNQGVSLGVITGFNADSDPTTRTAALTSEPATCVANLHALDLSAAPFSLPITARDTYSLPPAGEFAGAPDPASDVVIGVSERALDLAGHHAVASGAFCVTLDATSSPSLHRDALDDLLGVPLAASGDAPLRVVMQPTSALDFSLVDTNQVDATLTGLGLSLDVGDGDAGFSPALALTSDLTLHFALEPRRDASGPLELEPIVLKMDATTPVASAVDARYQGISPGDRASLLSSADDLVFATVGPAETRFALPTTVAAMTLGSLQFQRVTTTESPFLAILGALTPPPGAPPGTPTAKPVPTAVSIVQSDPASVRDALRGLGGALPEVHVELPGTGLEHSWRVHGGAWRPWQSGAELIISDRSFAWQGPRVLELRSRTDFTTTSAIASVNVVIDYAPPTLFASQAVVTATTITVPARDAVSPAGTLQRAVTAVGAPVPTSGFVTSDSVSLGALASEKDIVVYVRDEAGHTASTTVHLRGAPDAGSLTGGSAGGNSSVSHADAGAAPGAAGDAGADAAARPKSAASDAGGCGCRTTSQRSPRGTTFGLLALAALLGRAGRRRRCRRSRCEAS